MMFLREIHGPQKMIPADWWYSYFSLGFCLWHKIYSHDTNTDLNIIPVKQHHVSVAIVSILACRRLHLAKSRAVPYCGLTESPAWL